jgi:Flp pilus assembly protein TadG
MHPLRRVAGERGSATLELALVAPVLLLVVVGVLQFALWYHAREVALASAQDGARVASAENGTIGAGEQRTRTLLRAGLGDLAGDASVSGTLGRAQVAVEVTGSIRMLFPWPGGASLPIHVRAVAYRERFVPAEGTP